MKTKMMIVVALVAAILSSGCASDQYQRNRNAYNMGAAGALIGGGAAAILAHNVRGLGDDAAVLIPVSAAALGGAGYYIGSELDANSNAANAAMVQANTQIVMCSNGRGGFIPISVWRDGSGMWHAPDGSIYPNVPTAEQLKPTPAGPYSK